MSDLDKMNEALGFIRDEVKSASPRLDNLEKAHAELDKQEKENQKLMTELAEKANKATELEEKMVSLEADLKRGNFAGEKKAEKTEELKGFEAMLVKGVKTAHMEGELKFLRTDNNENGGYLAPSEYSNEIIKKITEVSPVRQVARVIPTTSKELKIAKRSGLVSGGWVGEGAAASASNSTYGEESLRPEKMMVYTDISIEMLRDAAFNMRNEITSDISEDFAKLEGAAFISGDGVGKPEGLLTNANVGTYNSGDASALTADSLFAIQGEIPSGYNLSWMLNRKTLHQHVRTLKNGSGDYLFQMGLGSTDMPNTIAGEPYFLANDMPDVAANANALIIGDFAKCYYIVDNVNIEFLEDAYTQATSGKRRFIAYKRTGGQVVLAEGLKKLKIAA